MLREFKTIGIIGKHQEPNIDHVLQPLLAILSKHGVNILLDAESVEPQPGFAEPVERERLVAEVDLIIAMGGDGTLLGAARSMAFMGTPLLGVNLGRLGFLADISPEKLEEKIEEVLMGQYVTEERSMLQASVWRDGDVVRHSIAANDVVLHTSDVLRMLEFDTSINGDTIRTHRADGFIVATPTGSTAYALSGGGPVLHPGLNAVVLVPICPHTLSDRPLVISADSLVTISLPSSGRAVVPAIVSWDGQTQFELAPGDTIEITRTSYNLRLIHPQTYDYFKRLRTKLNWG